MDNQMTTEEYTVTDEAPISSTAEVAPYFWEYELGNLVQAYPAVIFVIMGVIGNILVIAVLTRKSIYTSYNIFLLNLSVADLGVMLIGQVSRVIPRAFTGFDTGSYNRWICRTWFFANHSFATMSGWTLIAVTIERTIAVYLPLKAKEICTKKSAKWAIFAINIFSPVVYVHYFWTLDVIYEQRGNVSVLVRGCSIIQQSSKLGYYITVIRSATPFFCFSICNVMIISKLFVRQKIRKGLSSVANNDKKMRSLTVMLLTTNFAHLVCIAPMQIFYLIDKSDPFGRKITERWQAVVALRWAFALDLYYINHAINFFLYCISGSEFRAAAKALFADICRRVTTMTKRSETEGPIATLNVI